MSSGRKTTIAWAAVVAITITMSATSVAQAQSSNRPTLMDRFSSLKSTFKRDSKTRKTTQNSSRNASGGSKQGRPTYGSRSQTASSNNSRSNSSSKSQSKFGISNLIPNNLFGRKKPSSSSNSQRQQRSVVNSNRVGSSTPPAKVAVVDDKDTPQTESVPRTASRAPIDSAYRTPMARTQPRKSPQSNRDENLKETLSELLETDAIISGQVVVGDHESASREAIISDQEASFSEVLGDSESIVSDQKAAEPEDYLIEDEAIADAVVEEVQMADLVASEDALAEAIVEDSIVAETVVEEDRIASDPQLDLSDADPEEAEFADLDSKENVDSGAPELLSSEPTEFTNESLTAEPEEEEIEQARLDLHDALLSDELYEDYSEEVADHSIAETTPDESEESLEPEDLIDADLAEVNESESPPLEEVVVIPEPQPTTIAELEEPESDTEQDWDSETSDSQESPWKGGPQANYPSRPVNQSNSIDNQPKPITRLRKPGQDVLVSTEQPVIVSHVEGPSSILVGREASYRVTLENTSRTAAQNLSAVIHVPEWADLVDVDCTSGIVKQTERGNGGLDWQLPELGAHSSHTIHLQLIPRTGRKFQLGVQWSQDSIESQATVEVREPKLEMKISGPQEVLFGSSQRYRLTLRNPGNGLAEGVAVSLIPPGSDSSQATTHAVGTLGPDEVKELELELTAREAGELILQANATAAGGLETEAIRRVLCRKPELEVDWRGPDQKFAGTETAYYFRIRNPGTATTEPVEVKARLPEGIRFLSASDSYAVDSVTGVITWRLPSLTPGEEQFVQFQCELDRPGLTEFEVTARTIEGNVYDTTSVRTEVVALADLKLAVNDPRGARPIGEPVLYEIRVENRGSTDARGISIVGLFSEGIDPVSVEGAQNSVRDGRVTFQPIKSLPAGGEILLRIRAVASEVGTHIFRAEVVCEDLDIRLASEETTRFFEDEFHWDEGETPYTAENNGRTRVR